jgi:hypothetical protein
VSNLFLHNYGKPECCCGPNTPPVRFDAAQPAPR